MTVGPELPKENGEEALTGWSLFSSLNFPKFSLTSICQQYSKKEH